MYPEEQYAIRAMKAGAYGYIAKASASEELIQAIRKVSRGEILQFIHCRKIAFQFPAGSGTAAARTAFGPRVPDHLHDRTRQNCERDRGCAGLERQDREHPPNAYPGKDADENECRTDKLRHQAQPRVYDRLALFFLPE